MFTASARCHCGKQTVTDMRKLVGRLVSVHRLVLFLPDVHCVSDLPLVHSVAFSVDHLGTVPVFGVYLRVMAWSVSQSMTWLREIA